MFYFIFSGMGELHLDIIRTRIHKEYGVDADLGPLQISYRETIGSSAELTHTLDETVGVKRHQVTATVSVHPVDENDVFHRVEVVPHKDSKLITRKIRRFELQAVNDGWRSALNRGG